MKFLRNLLASCLGTTLASVLTVIILVAIFSSSDDSKETPKLENNSVLLIRLDKTIVERSVEDPFEDLDLPIMLSAQSNIGLNTILKAINSAATDPKIEGIYINNEMIMAGFSTLQDIREALVKFKESGKFIYSYNNNATQKEYYLASVADEVIFNPQGMFDFKGLTVTRTFYKNALEKLGVKVNIFRGPGNIYKSAVEPYMYDKMSDNSRTQTEEFLGSIWESIKTDIAISRDITPEKVDEIADRSLLFAPMEEAVSYGLVDKLMYKDELISLLIDKLEVDTEDDLNLISISKYAKTVDDTPRGYVENQIAVVYAEGAIDGTSEEGIKSKELSATIREIRNNENIKAVVLRVNSPGGSAFGSEVIWRELQLLKEEKPLIVSMGDYAASGGYYIAAPADKIFANQTTITGSIGIFATIPDASELISDKLGVTFDYVSTNKNGAEITLATPLTSMQVNQLDNYVAKGYDLFLSRVAEGRGVTKEQVDEVAKGRVWSGSEALKVGLVDEIGDLEEAIEAAKVAASIEDEYKVVDFPKIKTPFVEMIEKLTGETITRYNKAKYGEFYSIVEELKQVSSKPQIHTRLPYNINIE